MPLFRGIIFLVEIVDKEDIQTKSDDIFLEDVKKLITEGDFSSAISKLLLELTSNSNNIELLYLLSVSYRYNKNYSKAIESLNSLFALNPEHSRALKRWAILTGLWVTIIGH